MSLQVYDNSGQLPPSLEYIRYNDAFFNLNTKLSNGELTASILLDIDKATYVSPETFIGRNKAWGSLFKDNLSTGTKTLLNILQYPEKCFDVLECGNNALCFLRRIHTGNVVWNCIATSLIDDDEDCDIVYRGRHFTNIVDFLEFAQEVQETD